MAYPDFCSEQLIKALVTLVEDMRASGVAGTMRSSCTSSRPTCIVHSPRPTVPWSTSLSWGVGATTSTTSNTGSSWRSDPTPCTHSAWCSSQSKLVYIRTSMFEYPVAGLEFGQFEGKASWPWLLKIIRGHRGQYAGHQGHWYFKKNIKSIHSTQACIHTYNVCYPTGAYVSLINLDKYIVDHAYTQNIIIYLCYYKKIIVVFI